ncbi:hypothetical protein JI721_01300 [Alicyclobacillus cycloheptanicus]|uniref:ATP-dependent Clp protease ATP-binding subunit ClpA n=1 Tax=Alicyclobacillus cycloheptanicus TaxID=1457 RepID=A0ABT9XGP3_9BACL|nr:hypothetical protein [Alicyclobacillus cycloheptanicus]MDQ0189475.1 ATP-dependent Clp protease ATP-binding subunit ClpA [Alicyclobacillus cycloheptanicus]WDM01543.1 hypothetical protein JI721_01300 [Alicyclobacillus cycloheptanicus]
MHQIQQIRSIAQQLAAQEQQNAQILASQLAQKERNAAQLLQQCIQLCDQLQYQLSNQMNTQSSGYGTEYGHANFGVSAVLQADRNAWNNSSAYGQQSHFQGGAGGSSSFQPTQFTSGSMSNIMQADRVGQSNAGPSQQYYNRYNTLQ